MLVGPAVVVVFLAYITVADRVYRVLRRHHATKDQADLISVFWCAILPAAGAVWAVRTLWRAGRRAFTSRALARDFPRAAVRRR